VPELSNWTGLILDMFKFFSICTCFLLVSASWSRGQGTASGAKPTEHVIGTVAKADGTAHTVTVKEDKTGTEYTVLLANTKTLLKVLPGAKDLKTASRITAEDLQAGDRVDVRGTKPDENRAAAQPNTIEARSVVLMSGRDLAQAHQQETAEWQRSTAGTVNSVDAEHHTLSIMARTPEGPKPMTVQASAATVFTRYSVESPKIPVASQPADIQPGDQVRIIGQKSDDGATITAQKIYSGAFRTIAGTVTSISSDGKQLTVKDLQTKQPVDVNLTEDAAIRKLPPMMANMLARRFNPDYKAAGGGPPGGANTAGGNVGPSPSAGPPSSGAGVGDSAPGQQPRAQATGGGNGGSESAPGNGGPEGPRNSGPGGPPRPGNGDLSRLLERVPPIATSDLKPGDAVVISGVAQGADKSHLLASSIIAGVEPIFQSAPPQQGRSLGDWSLDMQVPAQQ
jgi:hypothetical protein